MKLLQISEVSVVDDNLDESARRLTYLLKLKPDDLLRRPFCENIKARLENCALSSWFSLYIRYISNQIYRASVEERGVFLDLVSNLQLNKFSNEYHCIPDRIKLFQLGKPIFFNQGTGYLYENGVSRDEKIKRWSSIISQPYGERLALFLLLEKTVLIIHEMGILSPGMVQNTIAKMSSVDKDPVSVIVGLVPILLELQKIAPGEQEDVVIPILDRMIEATLKFLGFNDNFADVVSAIRDHLVERYLHFVDVMPEVVREGDDRLLSLSN